jgi:phosphate transport system permease protein
MLFRWVCLAGALALFALVAIAIFKLFSDSREVWSGRGIGFITGKSWESSKNEYGALPLAWGTFSTSIIALLLGGGIGVGVAAFLVELAPKWLLKPVSFLIDLLAAIPSIIYGLWAVGVLIPFLRSTVYPELHKTFGWTGLFGQEGAGISGNGILTAGIVLAVMIIPTVAAVTREMLLVVPKTMRDGALALGATRTEALKGVQIPFAIGGILGGLILGLGRALGETMAVAMIIGNNTSLSTDLFKPASTLASVIALNFGEADTTHRSALIGLGLVLFVLTLCINVIARVLVYSVKRKSGVR